MLLFWLRYNRQTPDLSKNLTQDPSKFPLFILNRFYKLRKFLKTTFFFSSLPSPFTPPLQNESINTNSTFLYRRTKHTTTFTRSSLLLNYDGVFFPLDGPVVRTWPRPVLNRSSVGQVGSSSSLPSLIPVSTTVHPSIPSSHNILNRKLKKRILFILCFHTFHPLLHNLRIPLLFHTLTEDPLYPITLLISMYRVNCSRSSEFPFGRSDLHVRVN